MAEKIKKGLSMPAWIIDILDNEAEISGNIGDTVSAAIFDFCKKKPKEKSRIMNEFLSMNTMISYELESSLSVLEGLGERIVADVTQKDKKERRKGPEAG